MRWFLRVDARKADGRRKSGKRRNEKRQGKNVSAEEDARKREEERNKKIPAPGGSGDGKISMWLNYSAASAVSAVSATGAWPASASGAAAAFLERRVRLAFFSVLAMCSL